MAPVAALAQSPAREPHKAFAKSGTSAKVWSNEYWAQKGDVKLYMFRKRATAPNRHDGTTFRGCLVERARQLLGR